MRYTRKIQVVGNRSYSISLPKAWIKENRLNEQESLSLESMGNKVVITKQENNSKELLKKTIDMGNTIPIKELIILAYVKGVNELEMVLGGSQDRKHDLYQALRYTEGFKIIGEEKNRIIIKYIYKEAQVSVQDLLKRCLNILNQMIDCLEKNDSKTFDYLEDSLDSLYFVARRILYNIFFDQEAMEKNKIKDIEDISAYKTIFKKFEQIGDAIGRDKKASKTTTSRIKAMIEEINNIFILGKTHTTESLKNISKIKADNDSEKKIKNLSADILENKIAIDLNAEFF